MCSHIQIRVMEKNLICFFRSLMCVTSSSIFHSLLWHSISLPPSLSRDLIDNLIYFSDHDSLANFLQKCNYYSFIGVLYIFFFCFELIPQLSECGFYLKWKLIRLRRQGFSTSVWTGFIYRFIEKWFSTGVTLRLYASKLLPGVNPTKLSIFRFSDLCC